MSPPQKSLAHLRRDTRFGPLVKRYGAPELKRRGNAFRSLVRAIIRQQISGEAADSIQARFLGLFRGKRFPTPADINGLSLEKMRAVGLSPQKASYIQDLASKFSDGTIKHRSLHTMTSAEITEHLVRVKGIGIWTVHMFLIFTLARPDVLPTGDLGIRKGFQILYRLKKLPDHAEMEKLAKSWREYASLASWYLWRVADEAKIKARP